MTAEAWNALYPPGTVVRVWPAGRTHEPLVCRTRGAARQLAHGHAVVGVHATTRLIPLDLAHIEPLEDQ